MPWPPLPPTYARMYLNSSPSDYGSRSLLQQRALRNSAVIFDPACEFRNEASDEGGCFDLFQSPEVGETLEVEVFGVGTITTPNAILCYEIKGRVN